MPVVCIMIIAAVVFVAVVVVDDVIVYYTSRGQPHALLLSIGISPNAARRGHGSRIKEKFINITQSKLYLIVFFLVNKN